MRRSAAAAVTYQAYKPTEQADRGGVAGNQGCRQREREREAGRLGRRGRVWSHGKPADNWRTSSPRSEIDGQTIDRRIDRQEHMLVQKWRKGRGNEGRAKG